MSKPIEPRYPLVPLQRTQEEKIANFNDYLDRIKGHTVEIKRHLSPLDQRDPGAPAPMATTTYASAFSLYETKEFGASITLGGGVAITIYNPDSHFTMSHDAAIAFGRWLSDQGQRLKRDQ